MIVEGIVERVDEIRAARYDEEWAHALEDSLFQDFARWIAKRADVSDDVRAIAEEVLESSKIRFRRYRA